MVIEQPVLTVNEVFGPTIQGEGPAAGRHCLFLRLAECNLHCRWCDTAYTWAHTERAASHLDVPVVHDRAANARAMFTGEVIAALQQAWDIVLRPTTVVVSGGEPLIQDRALVPVAQALVAWGCPVHVETAGTLAPSAALADLVTQFVVSPKLANSGNEWRMRYRPQVLARFGDLSAATRFKFVVSGPGDLAEVDEIVAAAKISAHRVMIMPEGVTADAVARTGQAVVDEVLARGYGLSLRSHVVLWPGVDRGR